MITRYFVLLLLISATSCKSNANTLNKEEKIKVGAEMMEEYLPLLKGKRVGLVVNHTSVIGETHLLDTLLSLDINVSSIFAPEHGFRGTADAGAHIDNSKDSKTGIPIVSLYGRNKKPSADQLSEVDVLLFDIQDVGVRFYTYISTMTYIIEAAVETKKALIILDRPNPNGHYVAGPVLESKFKSFVGLNPIPVVYGLTMGELAGMINSESWVSQSKCDLTIIKCKNYDHTVDYKLPIKPSPNLPNQQSIWLYPSICLLEPTQISVGRGTDTQFQVLGGPDENLGKYHFIPVDRPGAQNPVNEGKDCYGLDLTQVDAKNIEFDISYLFNFYNKFQDKDSFFTSERFFNLLVGNDWILQDLKSGKNAEEVEQKWLPELKAFKELRKKYLLYPDFE